MAGTIKHRFTSAKSDDPDSTLIQASDWNDTLVVNQGSLGQVFTRDANQSDGWQLRDTSYYDVTIDPNVSIVGTNAQATQTAIQTALDNYLNVEFRPGTYLIDKALDLRSNHNILIHPGATIKATAHRTGSAGTWADDGMLQASGKSYIRIHGGGLIDGDKDTVGNLRIIGIKFENSCTDCTVDSMYIKDCPGSTSAGVLGGDGLYADGASSTRISFTNCTITGCVRQGISLIQGSHYRIVNCTIKNITGDNPGGGLDLEVNSGGQTITDVLVSGCTFDDCQQWIVSSNTGGVRSDMNLTVSGCTFKSARAGGSTGGLGVRQPGWTITGNTFYNDSGNAIYMRVGSGATPSPINSTVTGNKFYGAGDTDERSCILIEGGKGVSIVGNSFYATDDSAIRLDTNTNSSAISNVVISSNVMTDCVRAGATDPVIALFEEATNTYHITYLTVTDNQIFDTRSGGDEADFGIQTSQVAETEQDTWNIHSNHIEGVADRYSGAAGTLLAGRVLCRSATLDFDLSAVTYQDLTVTVTGAAGGDFVVVGAPATGTNGVIFFGWVSATDTVTVRAATVTGTPNPASGTFSVMVIRRQT